MTRYLLRRLFQSFLMVIGLLVIVFFLVRLSGDPVSLLAPRDATPEQREEIRQAYGLDRPLPVQFGEFVVDAARFDFGTSIRFKQPVTEVALERMPATLELGVAALLLATVIGIPLGIIAGVRAGSRTDGTVRGFALLGQTVPDFWLALVLIVVFAVNLRWFPTFGRETMSLGPLTVPDRSIVLPAVALSLFPMAQLVRFTRSSVLEIVGEDYVRIGRSKGIPTRLIYSRYILKNTLIPLISVFGLIAGALLSGSLYIEAVFSWPGAGGLMAEAVGNRDFPLVQGLAFLGGLITIVFSLLSDVLYSVADPRVRVALARDRR
jgi:ABC-type dipeptide/oligopeptide/nickel transport system permease component